MNKDQRKSPPFRAVLWDFDGTIMDSQAGILRSMRHSLETLGCEVPAAEEFGKWVGPPFPKSLRNWTTLDDAGVDEAGRIYKDHYEAFGADEAEPFPGMTELVHALHQQGVPLGLATSKPCGTAFRQLEGIGLLNLFSASGCAAEDESRGSKIEVMSDALEGLSHLSFRTSEIVMIGDRIHDFEASRKLGVTCVAVRWGYGNPDEWAHADYQVDTPDELAAFCQDNVSEFLITVD